MGERHGLFIKGYGLHTRRLVVVRPFPSPYSMYREGWWRRCTLFKFGHRKYIRRIRFQEVGTLHLLPRCKSLRGLPRGSLLERRVQGDQAPSTQTPGGPGLCLPSPRELVSPAEHRYIDGRKRSYPGKIYTKSFYDSVLLNSYMVVFCLVLVDLV